MGYNIGYLNGSIRMGSGFEPDPILAHPFNYLYLSLIRLQLRCYGVPDELCAPALIKLVKRFNYIMRQTHCD